MPETTVKYNPAGLVLTTVADTKAGQVRAEYDYQVIYAAEQLESPGYALGNARAYLNDMLITDPVVTQWLLQVYAGIGDPPHLLGPRP